MLNQEIKRISHLLTETDASYHDAALKLGLSDSALKILYTICENGEECLLSDIIHLSGVRKQTINSALRKLEDEGIVFLKPAGVRTKKVCLTDKGKETVKDTVLKVMAIENKIFGSWERHELDMYIELTQRYLTALREEIKEL